METKTESAAVAVTVNDPRQGETSASNAEYDLACPARHLAQKGLEEPKSSDDATTGSRVHFALSAEDNYFLTTVTLAEREIFDACREIEKRQVIKFFGQNPVGRIRAFRERSDGSTRLWVRIPGPNGKVFRHSGQPDVVFVNGVRALIVEYKTLAGDVPDAPSNQQLRDQAALAAGNYKVDEVGTVVVQPLVTHDPVICLYDKAALERATREMFDRVRASNDPTSKPFPGERQCAFCLAKTRCLEYQRWAGGMVPGMLSLLDVPVSAWTPEQCAMFLAKKSVAQKWLDGCHDEIYARLEKDPEGVPGYYLKPGAKKETITDAQKVFERFTLLGGKLEQFMGCIAVGKRKLEEQVSAVTGARGKSLSDAIKTLTNGLTQVSQNKPSIAKREDSAQSAP